MVIRQEPYPRPSATHVFRSLRPDWTFGQMGQRAKLSFGGKTVEPDDPQYDLIKKLILQKYINGLYGQ